jgi:hypothetical protein
MSAGGGFTDVQVSMWAYWECGTCGRTGDAGPLENGEEYEPPEHDCEGDS